MSLEYLPRCLVSACLCGVPCRYNGQSSTVDRLAVLHHQGLVLAVCPEVDGGLPVPRAPCELKNGRALTREGRDMTAFFEAGAVHALRLAQAYAIRVAIMKERSPSCGGVEIYDGSFSGVRVPGQGLAVALLRGNGIRVVSERDAEAVLEELFSLYVSGG